MEDDEADERIELRQSTLSDALKDDEQRKVLRLPVSDDEPCPVVVELNLTHAKGLGGAEERFRELYEELEAPGKPRKVANTYMACTLTINQVKTLIARDEEAPQQRDRAIYRIWPDFPVKALIDKSVATVKADAARRSYEASGTDITWAVIDSGIDAQHPHFTEHETLEGDVETLHKDFTEVGDSPLTNEYGHGTHVAGIIAGGLPEKGPAFVARKVARDMASEGLETRKVSPERLSGVAPNCKLISLKVLDERGRSRSIRSSRRCSTSARSSTATPSCCASTASTSASATSSTRAGSPAARARSASRSTGW